MSIGSTLLWHEFGVVPDLPLEVLIGADVLAAYQCSLLHLKIIVNVWLSDNRVVLTADRFRHDPEIEHRLKRNTSFVTPRDAVIESNWRQLLRDSTANALALRDKSV